DSPLPDFLRMGMHAEVEYPGLHLVHATLVEKGDLAICGLGEGHAPEQFGDSELFTRTMAEYHLRPFAASSRPNKVLLLAAPPPGSLVGDAGCQLSGELLDTYHPRLCVVGGTSERRGWERVARTLTVNPGALAEGWAAWVDWTRPADDQVEILNLRDLEASKIAVEVGVCD